MVISSTHIIEHFIGIHIGGHLVCRRGRKLLLGSVLDVRKHPVEDHLLAVACMHRPSRTVQLMVSNA